MKRSLLLLGIILSCTFYTFGQTEEELKTQKAEKQAEVTTLQGQIDALNGEIAGIDAQLVKFPRWENGAFGVFGLGFNGFNDWLSRAQPNITSTNIGIGLNGFANYFTENSFWRNSGNINMGWLSVDDKDNPNDSDTLQSTSDAINISSLYGYKFSEQFAASALGEYRSTIVSNFNNPGYLDIGVGATWTPITNLVVVIHPLNYNFVFSNQAFDFESSLGAKIVADYTAKLAGKVDWKSNFSTFQSYKSSDLSNWTWINSVAFNVAKGFGVGAELGLRSNKQEALAAEAGGRDLGGDNPLQTYYVVGLTYNISSK
ncbi:MAG: DUF3078 domain-containing protein [Bacteroidota bacterium]